MLIFFMPNEITLTEIALVVTAALLGGIGFSRLKQPPILGYILTGIILGPSGFALINSRAQVDLLAELGVLLLLFVIGMDLSLRTFKKYWSAATLCTLFQIILSVVITLTLSNIFGWSSGLSLLLGFVVSLSSTAVVVKMLESLGETKKETGQLAIGILIAQDFAIIPMILILRNYGESFFTFGMFFKIIISFGLIVGIVTYFSQRQLVRLPFRNLLLTNKDITPLATLAFCFASAALAGLCGLSAPYGAFLAGIVLGNTHERVVMLETVRPIQSTLLMAFFLSIGLLLDVPFIWKNLSVVLSLLLIITVGKTALNILILRFLKLPWSQSFIVGVMLAQVGEFAFLLASVGFESAIINEFGERLIIGLCVLSLAFSPIWLAMARRLKELADKKTLTFRNIIEILIGRNALEEITLAEQDQTHTPQLPDETKP